MDEVIALVEAGAKGTKRGMIFLGVFMIGLGVLGLVFLDPSDAGSRMARRAILGAYVLPVIGAVLIVWFSVRKHKGLEALRSAPDQICWWYIENRGQNGVFLVLGLLNGKTVKMGLMNLQDAQKLQGAGPTAFPNATSGFSPENQSAFARDPGSLRRA